MRIRTYACVRRPLGPRTRRWTTDHHFSTLEHTSSDPLNMSKSTCDNTNKRKGPYEKKGGPSLEPTGRPTLHKLGWIFYRPIELQWGPTMAEWKNIVLTIGGADKALNGRQYATKAEAARALVEYKKEFHVKEDTE